MPQRPVPPRSFRATGARRSVQFMDGVRAKFIAAGRAGESSHLAPPGTRKLPPTPPIACPIGVGRSRSAECRPLPVQCPDESGPPPDVRKHPGCIGRHRMQLFVIDPTTKSHATESVDRPAVRRNPCDDPLRPLVEHPGGRPPPGRPCRRPSGGRAERSRSSVEIEARSPAVRALVRSVPGDYRGRKAVLWRSAWKVFSPRASGQRR